MKLTIKVEQDTDPMNPRTEWDNLGTMVCFHNKYILGDEDHDYKLFKLHFEMRAIRGGDYSVWDMLERRLVSDGAAVILPLYLYDHGGITMSCGSFPCGWDSGQVGFIFISKEKARKEYGWKRLTKKRLEKLETYLRGEVETYDQYLTGDVWGYIIEDEDGEHVDSCWGYFGEEAAREEAEAQKKWFEEDERAQELARSRIQIPCGCVA